MREYHRRAAGASSEAGVRAALMEAAAELGYTGCAWAVAGEGGLAFREEVGQLAPLARFEAGRCLGRRAPQRLGSAVAFPVRPGSGADVVLVMAPVEGSDELAELTGVAEEVATDLERLRRTAVATSRPERELATAAFHAAAEALMVTDLEGRIRAVNPAFSRQTGWEAEEALGQRPGDLLRSDRRNPDLFQRAFRTLAREGRWQGVVCNRCRDGNYIIHRETIEAVSGDDGAPTHYVATLADITPFEEAERRIRQERDYAEGALASLPGPFLFLDVEGRCRRSNRRAEVDGEPPTRLADLVEPGDREAVESALATALHEGAATVEATLRDGVPHCFQLRAVELEGERLVCALGVDVSRQRALAAELERLARTDHLTGCGTRQHAEEQIDHLLARQRREGSPFSVILFDIDHFKRINDEYGHSVGDRALIGCVDYLRQHTREMDWLCRWGGEEFLLILPGVTVAEASETARRLAAGLTAAGPLAGEALTLSAGVTAACVDDDRERLIARADASLYCAKENGRDRVCSAEGGCRRRG